MGFTLCKVAGEQEENNQQENDIDHWCHIEADTMRMAKCWGAHYCDSGREVAELGPLVLVVPDGVAAAARMRR